jgi:hypothetical protein
MLSSMNMYFLLLVFIQTLVHGCGQNCRFFVMFYLTQILVLGTQFCLIIVVLTLHQLTMFPVLVFVWKKHEFLVNRLMQIPVQTGIILCVPLLATALTQESGWIRPAVTLQHLNQLRDRCWIQRRDSPHLHWSL